MKDIFIMLTQVGTIISKSIKLYTKAKYNHSSISTDPDIKVFYSFARRIRFLPFIAGFIREEIHEGMFRYYPDTECIIYSLNVEDDQYDRIAAEIEKYITDEIDYKYNFLALFGVPINKPFDSQNRHTCAEFVANVLHEAGIYTFLKPFSLVRPDDIPGIPGLNVVYEGMMNQFKPDRFFKDPA